MLYFFYCIGSGKSEVISRICNFDFLLKGRIVITVPSVALLYQLSDNLEQKYPGEIGLYHTLEKEISKRITICTLQSLSSMVTNKKFLPVQLWIADEAHRTETEKIKTAVSKYLRPEAAIGFTSTPFRNKKTENLSLFTTEIYRYSLNDAMRDKCLVGFTVVNFEFEGYEVDDAAIQMIKTVITRNLGPGFVNARTIEDAKEFAERLRSEGIPAAAIHSQNDLLTNKELLNDLKSGKYKALVHVNMLIEGKGILLFIIFFSNT